jgi:hypothetical protein
MMKQMMMCISYISRDNCCSPRQWLNCCVVFSGGEQCQPHPANIVTCDRYLSLGLFLPLLCCTYARITGLKCCVNDDRGPHPIFVHLVAS